MLKRSISSKFEFGDTPTEIWALIVRITILTNFNSIRSMSLSSKALCELVDNESRVLLRELFPAVNEALDKKFIPKPHRCVFFKATLFETRRLVPTPELTPAEAGDKSKEFTEPADFLQLASLRKLHQDSIKSELWLAYMLQKTFKKLYARTIWTFPPNPKEPPLYND